MITASPAGQTARDRLVPLAGAVNFRDLGGYRTADGRTVRWCCVYRSDALDQLTDPDVEVLAAPGPRLVCDLRNDREVSEAPSRLPNHPEPQRLRFPIGGDTGETTSILELILAGEIRARTEPVSPPPCCWARSGSATRTSSTTTN